MKKQPVFNFPTVWPSVVFCLLFFVGITLVTGKLSFWYLLWNLFLAWIPFALAKVLTRRSPERRPGWQTIGIAIVWLLFLPNTFYMLTDFVHLSQVWSIYTDLDFVVWLEILLIGSFVWVGMLYGFSSLRAVDLLVRDRYPAVKYWFVLVVLFLCSIGIYLGRLARFNSWDVIVRPHQLAQYVITDIGQQGYLTFIGFAGIFTLLLFVIYATLYEGNPHGPKDKAVSTE